MWVDQPKDAGIYKPIPVTSERERKTMRVFGLAYALIIGGGALASMALLYALVSIVLGWLV